MDLKAENVLIVESKNDKFFIENLLKHINKSNLEVANSFVCCGVDDYECMEGLDIEKMCGALGSQKGKAGRGLIKRIGILIDQDNKTTAQRLDFINEAVAKSFAERENPKFTQTSKFETFQFLNSGNTINIEIACFFNGVNGQGELETVLKDIASKTANYADCLNQWRACLATKNIQFSQKSFDKLWINFYSRYDTCSKEDMQQAHSKCSFEAALQKEIWNLDAPVLDDLKAFLQLFT